MTPNSPDGEVIFVSPGPAEIERLVELAIIAGKDDGVVVILVFKELLLIEAVVVPKREMATFALDAMVPPVIFREPAIA